MEYIQMKYIVASLVYTGVGLGVLIVAFVLFDVLTPRISIWKELIEKQNIAMAIFLASVVIGIATIIASAIHG